MKYIGGFTSAENINEEFRPERKGDKTPDVTDAEVLFAHYGFGDYQGDAIVVYERDGKLYEVNGGHCSCSGLEGQWCPEETSWAALAIRKFDTCGKDKDLEFLRELIKERNSGN